MERNICYNCFGQLSGGEQFCPVCGYGELSDKDKYPFALAHGTVLAGRYIVGKTLGQGGFGITYVAQDYNTKQRVAIKEFFPDTMAARKGATQVAAFTGERGESFNYGKGCFLDEARTLAEFNGNPNIVDVHSYFEENGTAYFVMDYVDGESLQSYVKKYGGKVGWKAAKNILMPVMAALAAVHSKGMIHRDVTPDNIFITKNGTVKLIDFGAARYSLGDKSRSLDVVLKHGFAPKEQYTRRGRQGPYTDVYSVAASMYFITTGRLPPDSIDRLDEDDLVPPSRLGVDIPPAEEDALMKAMSVQPADRYQSMKELMQALSGQQNAVPAAARTETAFSGTPPTPVTAPAPAPTPAPVRASAAPQGSVIQTVFNAPQQRSQQPQPSIQPAYSSPQPTGQYNTAPQPVQKQKKNRLVPVVAAAAVLLVGGGIILAANSRRDDGIDTSSAAESSTSAAAAAANADADSSEAAVREETPSRDEEVVTEVTTKKNITEVTAQDIRIKGAKQDISVGYGDYICTGSYEGDLSNDVPDGSGKFSGSYTDSDGEKFTFQYDGDFSEGSLNGQGKASVYGNSLETEYDGEWVGGLKWGEGTLTKRSAEDDIRETVYTGDFVSDVRSGTGTCTWTREDGSLAIYTGDWADDAQNGTGVHNIYFANGNSSVYEGEWKDGDKHGQGKSTYNHADGQVDVYEGEFKAGLRNGTGKSTVTMPDGTIHTYNGSWENSERNGEGKYTWKYPSGIVTTYTGEWVGDERNGEGKEKTTYTDGTKKVLKGTFKGSELYTGTVTTYDSSGKATGKLTYKKGKQV